MHGVIVEPFAGAAGYSLRYASARVHVNDADPVVAGVWDFLVRGGEAEVRRLPLLEPGQLVSDLGVCQEARWFIGFWVNPGSARPKERMSSFGSYPRGHRQHRSSRCWGEAVRARVAAQVGLVAHWTVGCAGYGELPDREATWFVDPPYQRAGAHYAFGSAGIDYETLGRWCMRRPGQLIACEAAGADWLPFVPLFSTGTAIGGAARRRYAEVVFSYLPTRNRRIGPRARKSGRIAANWPFYAIRAASRRLVPTPRGVRRARWANPAR